MGSAAGAAAGSTCLHTRLESVASNQPARAPSAAALPAVPTAPAAARSTSGRFERLTSLRALPALPTAGSGAGLASAGSGPVCSPIGVAAPLICFAADCEPFVLQKLAFTQAMRPTAVARSDAIQTAPRAAPRSPSTAEAAKSGFFVDSDRAQLQPLTATPVATNAGAVAATPPLSQQGTAAQPSGQASNTFKIRGKLVNIITPSEDLAGSSSTTAQVGARPFKLATRRVFNVQVVPPRLSRFSYILLALSWNIEDSAPDF